MTLEQIAEMAHETNRLYCHVIKDGMQKVPWAELSSSEQVGLIHAVKAVTKDATPEGQHLQWMNAKKSDGWVHGRTLDRVRKIHPDMVPYPELSETQKTKDVLFLAVVKSLKAF